MKTVIQRYLWPVVLAVWGGTLGYFYFSDRLGKYLHPSFHIWTAVSAVLLVLMALGLLLLPAGQNCCAGDCVHPAKSLFGQTFSAVVLIVPLILAAVVSPSQFGMAAVENRGVVQNIADLPAYTPYEEPPLPTPDGVAAPTNQQTAADTEGFLPKNEKGQIKAQTIDLLYAAQEPTMREDFENKEVEMIGQYLPAKDNNSKGNRFSLVQMFVMCCAADAKPVGVNIQSPKPDNVADMSWVRITGKATFPLEGGRHVPIVVADSVTPCDPPSETFIFNN